MNIRRFPMKTLILVMTMMPVLAMSASAQATSNDSQSNDAQVYQSGPRAAYDLKRQATEEGDGVVSADNVSADDTPECKPNGFGDYQKQDFKCKFYNRTFSDFKLSNEACPAVKAADIHVAPAP